MESCNGSFGEARAESWISCHDPVSLWTNVKRLPTGPDPFTTLWRMKFGIFQLRRVELAQTQVIIFALIPVVDMFWNCNVETVIASSRILRDKCSDFVDDFERPCLGIEHCSLKHIFWICRLNDYHECFVEPDLFILQWEWTSWKNRSKHWSNHRFAVFVVVGTCSSYNKCSSYYFCFVVKAQTWPAITLQDIYRLTAPLCSSEGRGRYPSLVYSLPLMLQYNFENHW